MATAFLKSNYTGLGSDSIQITSIEVSPDPPQPGKDLTVTVKGVATKVIEVC